VRRLDEHFPGGRQRPWELVGAGGQVRTTMS